MLSQDWASDFADPMGILTPAFVTDNAGGWTDPEYLGLLHDANRTLDPRARMEKLAQAETRLMHEMPLLALTFEEAHLLRKPYVHNMDPDPMDGFNFRYTWIDTGWKP